MPSVVNRSPFLVVPRSKANSDKARKFRSRSAAEEYQAELGAAGVPASVRQEEIGSWEAVVRMLDGAGKRHEGRRRFDTEEQANAWAEDEERKIIALRASSAPIAAAKTKFSDAVKVWNEKCGSKLAGAKVIDYNIPAVVARIGADLPLDEITVAVVRKFRDGMVEDGYAASTIANHRQIISGTFRYFISEMDFPDDNPCLAVQWPQQENSEAPPKLTEAQFTALLKVIGKRSPWLVPVVEWAGESAMRRSEILRMEWDHVDFDGRRLRIPKEKNDHQKKKTEAKGREIPLWPALVSILDRLQPDRDKRSGKVFPGTLDSVSHAFTQCVRGSDFSGLTFHSMRKVATGRLSEKLPNVVELSRVTAHRDIKTLATVYYGTNLDDLAEKIAKPSKPDPLADLAASLAKIAESGEPGALEKVEALLARMEKLKEAGLDTDAKP